MIAGVITAGAAFCQYIDIGNFEATIVNVKNADFSALNDGFAGLSWSIIGVFLLYLTLHYQRVDFKDSEKTNNKQRFETTFFNMLSMLNQIRDSMTRAIANKQQVSGYMYIEHCINDLKRGYTNIKKSSQAINDIENQVSNNEIVNSVDIEILRDEVKKVYEEFYSRNHAYIGHYFRYIYHIVEFVITEREKSGDIELYLKIVQAQLSDNELSLLFYNCLSKYAEKKDNREPRFYNNLDKYGFLENVDSDSLLSRNHHILYPQTNFKFLNSDEKEMRKTSYISKPSKNAN